MNKPAKIKRHTPATMRRITPKPGGQYSSGIQNPEFAKCIGGIVTAWPHLEEAMIQIFALLIGEKDGTAAAYPIFRSITAERLRLTIMKTLLEESPINVTKSEQFDEIIAEFATLNKSRNDYVHGLWWTHESGKVYLVVPTANDPNPIFKLRKQSLKMAKDILKRIGKLTIKAIFLSMDVRTDAMLHEAWLERLSQRPSADGSADRSDQPAK